MVPDVMVSSCSLNFGTFFGTFHSVPLLIDADALCYEVHLKPSIFKHSH